MSSEGFWWEIIPFLIKGADTGKRAPFCLLSGVTLGGFAVISRPGESQPLTTCVDMVKLETALRLSPPDFLLRDLMEYLSWSEPLLLQV